MHDVFTFSFPWEFFDMKYIKLITLISPWGIHSTMGEQDADKRDLRKRDCPELNISLDKRCCIYVNTGHCWKLFRRQVCVYRAYGMSAYVRVRLCVSVCPRSSSGMRKIYTRLRELFLLPPIFSMVWNYSPIPIRMRLQTVKQTERKRTEAKSYFENCVASLLGGGKRNSFSSGCQLTTSQTLKESEKERSDKTFMDKAAQPCVQTFVSKDTSWKGEKIKKKKTVYRLDISHNWKYVFPELTFLVITKRFLFSPFSANEKKNVIHNRYYFSYTEWFSNVKKEK